MGDTTPHTFTASEELTQGHCSMFKLNLRFSTSRLVSLADFEMWPKNAKSALRQGILSMSA